MWLKKGSTIEFVWIIEFETLQSLSYETKIKRIELYNNRYCNIWDVINYKIDYQSTPYFEKYDAKRFICTHSFDIFMIVSNLYNKMI